MKLASLFLLCTALLLFTACSKDKLESYGPADELHTVFAEGQGKETTEVDNELYRPGCTVYPRGIVKALSTRNQVTILPSNSDFINHIWLVAPHVQFIGTDDEWGKVEPLSDVANNAELVFEIRVHDSSNVPMGVSWFTGPGSRNADGAVHAIIEKCPARTYIVNFEDLSSDAWGAADEPNYVDAIFEVTPR